MDRIPSSVIVFRHREFDRDIQFFALEIAVHDLFRGRFNNTSAFEGVPLEQDQRRKLESDCLVRWDRLQFQRFKIPWRCDEIQILHVVILKYMPVPVKHDGSCYTCRMEYDVNTAFSTEDVRRLVSSPLYDELMSRVAAYGCSCTTSFSRCSLAYGWNLKIRRRSRPVAVVYPRPGGFSVLVVIGRKEREGFEILLPSLSASVAGTWERARDMNGQRWLMIDVSSQDVLEDVVSLMELRMDVKKPATN